MKEIKLYVKCLICEENTTNTFVCWSCRHKLPKDFFQSKYYYGLAPYIPEEQYDQFIARYIIKHFKVKVNEKNKSKW